jgi:hypothetical protein
MPISNEIFETYRMQEKLRKESEAVRFLANQGFTILDTKGNIINKHNINEKNKPKWKYKTVREN